jgi:hypothetical protein
MCVLINAMIHGGTNNSVNNLPVYVWSLTFGSDTQAVLRVSDQGLAVVSKIFRSPLHSRKAGFEILNSSLLLLVLPAIYKTKRETRPLGLLLPSW